jgi:hypothetical protein
VPSDAAGFEHAPVDALQVPATWHWSDATHVTGLPPVQTPAWQVSIWVQALPSLQTVPFVTGVCVHAPLVPQLSTVQGFPSSQDGGVHVTPPFGNPSSNVYGALELPTSMSRARNAPVAQIPDANDSVPFGASTRAWMLPPLPSAAAFGDDPSAPSLPLTPDTSMRMSFAVSVVPEAGPMKKLDPALSRFAIRICTVPSASTRPLEPMVRSYIW